MSQSNAASLLEIGLPGESRPAGHEPGLAPPENRVFYPALDGLRAVAVLVVFFHHYRLRTWTWLSWGWVGVDVFFVLSGFLITGILYDTRHRAHRFRDFYARRTLRIFPLYYALCLALLLLTPVLRLHWTPRWLLWPLYLGNYTHLAGFHSGPQEGLDWLALHAHTRLLGGALSFGHLWSLSVEEQFYLAWPLLVYTVMDRRRLLRLCAAAIAILPALRAVALLTLPRSLIAHELLYRSTLFRCDALLLGGALALLLRGPHAARLLRIPGRLFLLSVGLCGLVGFVAIHFHNAPVSGVPTVPWIAVLGLSLVDFAAVALVLLAIQPHRALARVLNLRPLRALGRISYGFYVFHDIFHAGCVELAHRLHPAGTGQMLGMLFALPLTLALSTLSYSLLEKPFLQLKRHFPG